MPDAPYFKVWLNKERDKELIRWLLRGKIAFESASRTARRNLYWIMQDEKSGKRRSVTPQEDETNGPSVV